MKIIYSIGDRLSCNLQAMDVLQYLSGIKIAGYASISSSYIQTIDWNLDAIKLDKTKISKLYYDVEAYAPDLVIVDAEPILAKVANFLNIKVISISGLHAIDGIQLEFSQKTKYKNIIKKAKNILRNLKVEDRYVYSPFGDLYADPPLNEGYEWVSCTLPYSNTNGNIIIIPDKPRIGFINRLLRSAGYNFSLSNINMMTNDSVVFSSGESSILSNALERGNYILLSPSLNDPEAVFNASVCSEYGLGIDLGKVEILGRYALNIIKIPEKIQKVKFHKKNKTIADIIGEQDARSV